MRDERERWGVTIICASCVNGEHACDGPLCDCEPCQEARRFRSPFDALKEAQRDGG